MFIINVVKVPGDSRGIIFFHFIFSEGLTASRNTAIHITTDNIAVIVIISFDIICYSLNSYFILIITSIITLDISFTYILQLKVIILLSQYGPIVQH